MDLDFAIVLAQLQLLLRAKVLVAKEHNTPLGNHKRELVSLLVAEVFELQTDDLGPDVRVQVLDFFRSGEEGGLFRVCSRAGVDVLTVVVPKGVDVL